jgi:FkbM family methyltransferase
MDDDMLARLDEFADIQREFEKILQTLVMNDTTIIDALAQMLGAIQQMQGRAEQMQSRVEQTQTRLAASVEGLGTQIAQLCAERRAQQPIVEDTDEFAAENPEIGLLAHIRSFLEDTTALDVGAHDGAVAERLLRCGYAVWAFEPYGPSFAQLEQRLAGCERFHGSRLAVGPADREMVLNIAEDLSAAGKWNATLFNSLVDHPMLSEVKFTKTVPVTVRSLESLQKSGEIPDSAGLLKIDTEGLDLEVIAGMGKLLPSIVMAEFWDGEHPFGRAGHGRLDKLVSAMRRRGYEKHIVVYHVDPTSTISYYCGRSDTVRQSWGNAVFFRDHAVFVRAVQWCETMLTPTMHR